MLFALYIRGRDDKTRIVRRNLVRYMVLTQALVLRDISMQVVRRFRYSYTRSCRSENDSQLLIRWPLRVSFKHFEENGNLGLMTEEEMHVLDEIHDPYSRYWAPIQWFETYSNRDLDLQVL